MMSVQLPANKAADINILNIFKQGTGDTITFTEDGFDVKVASINGTPKNFADYVLENKIDTKLPLVADYSGAAVNISIKAVDADNQNVSFYAPVFKDVRYRFAQPVDNYFKEFMSQVLENDFDEFYTANTVNDKTVYFFMQLHLNYVYSNLEGMRTGEMIGPITFGEVAYQL